VRDYKPSRTKGIKIVSIFHRLDNEVVGTHSVVPFKSMTDKKKQKISNFFSSSGGTRNPISSKAA